MRLHHALNNQTFYWLQFLILLSAIQLSRFQTAKSKICITRKSTFEQPVETRNIKYIDVLVTPSEEDRKEVLNEVTEYANQLGTAADMNTFIRSTGSVVPFLKLQSTRLYILMM